MLLVCRGHASEIPELPQSLAAKGIRFLGPPAEAMAALGDKVSAGTSPCSCPCSQQLQQAACSTAEASTGVPASVGWMAPSPQHILLLACDPRLTGVAVIAHVLKWMCAVLQFLYMLVCNHMQMNPVLHAIRCMSTTQPVM